MPPNFENISVISSPATPYNYNNATAKEQELFQDFYEISSLVRITVPLCFGVIALTGFFGNILVILVVCLNKQMHSTTNLLIVNLAVADLLFVIFCIPFTAADYVADSWPFGDLWCRTVQYLIVVAAFTSIYTLVLMSIDRFLAVVHPIRSRMLRTEKITKICIAAIWTVILLVCLPVAFTHGVVLILLLKALYIYHADTKFTVILQVVAQTLAYASSCINPVLYAFLSDNFRKAFHKAINCSNRFQNYSSDLPPARKTSYARTSSTGF
ncbi:allatostatin-A receptor [Lucilia cuprina]|uniref:allatostatin-A receptor n=1 Tax=Lucilia cuprina TaxID=7375 RepID=UPI001F053C04|nr:allatostatin-A receptor [Lucilia cuprina]